MLLPTRIINRGRSHATLLVHAEVHFFRAFEPPSLPTDWMKKKMSCCVCSKTPVDRPVKLPKTLDGESAIYCRSCLVGQRVAAYIPSQRSWKVGSVAEYHSKSDQALLAYGRDLSIEWVQIEPDPFHAYVQAKHRNELCKQALLRNGESSANMLERQSGVSTGESYIEFKTGAEAFRHFSPMSSWDHDVAGDFSAARVGGDMSPMVYSPCNAPTNLAGVSTVRSPPRFAPRASSPRAKLRIKPRSSTGILRESKYGTGTTSLGATQKVQKSHRPTPWTAEDDAKLYHTLNHRRMSPPIRWEAVAESVPGRTGKQCRERYVNHVKPLVNTAEWTPIEDALLYHTYAELGPKWAALSRILPGRTDNSVKNRFHRLEKVTHSRRVPIDDYPLFQFGNFVSLQAGRDRPCMRCCMFVPSQQTGLRICSKTSWCERCAETTVNACRESLRSLRLNEEQERQNS